MSLKLKEKETGAILSWDPEEKMAYLRVNKTKSFLGRVKKKVFYLKGYGQFSLKGYGWFVPQLLVFNANDLGVKWFYLREGRTEKGNDFKGYVSVEKIRQEVKQQHILSHSAGGELLWVVPKRFWKKTA